MVTLGFLQIICYFYRHLWIYLTHIPCKPHEASVVHITDRQTGKTYGYFNVEYFTCDGLKVKPADFFEHYLKASEFIWPRLEISNDWWLFYDENEQSFVRNEPPSLKSSRQICENQQITDVDLTNDEILYLKSGITTLNDGKDDEQEFVAFKEITLWKYLLFLEFFLSGGIFWLFCYWQPLLKLYLTHKRCSLLSADSVLLMIPPGKKAKNEKHASELFPEWCRNLLNSGALHLLLIVTPVGIFIMLALIIASHITLRRKF